MLSFHVIRANVRQDFMSGTPSSTAKPHAVARGPRSGPSAVPKMTNVQSPTISNGSSPGLISSNNRKRGLSTRSSSPPVAQWADRRPQKISRTARRTNLIPVLSTNDEVPPSSNSNGNVSEKGRGFAKRFPANSPKQFKSKVDHNIPSSSEDSGARDSLKSEEIGDKDAVNGQRRSTLVVPTKKNKFMNEKHHRSGRGFASARSVGNVGTEKQLRTGRVGFDKPERFYVFCYLLNFLYIYIYIHIYTYIYIGKGYCTNSLIVHYVRYNHSRPIIFPQ
ncbi:hypothetical protein HanOQP8_Chr09g0304731 [Helianthus annuus]|nr:hypothetical protein HanOQP8_Chr09g0304731 [Helianthus annuus]